MKIKHSLAIAAAALAIGISPVFISAQTSDDDTPIVREDRPRRPHQPPHKKPHDLVAFWEKEGIAEELALDDSQISQLEESLEAAKSAVEGEKEILKAAMENLRDLMEVDNPDLDAVLAAIDEVSASKTTIAKSTSAHRVAVKNILTEEQEEILKAEIRNQMRDRVRDRRGGGFPGGPFAGDEAGEGFPPPHEAGDLPDLPEQKRSRADRQRRQ